MKQSVRRFTSGVVLTFGLTIIPASVTPAQAFIFHDGPAFVQRIAQLIQVLAQWNQIIRTSGQQLMAFKSAYDGLKDWRNMGWVDVLRLADSPWFDGIDGIDDIRQGADLTVMSAEQAQALWANEELYRNLLTNPRYAKDPWYRMKVNSIMRQSKRAAAVKASILRQFKQENKGLIADVKRIQDIKTTIEQVNQVSPVDATKLASLQAELASVEAKYKGNGLIVKNQQAIMMLMGENDAQKAFVEVIDRGWMRNNSAALKSIGTALGGHH